MSLLAETSSGLVTAAPCSTCGFALWIPITRLDVSSVGLYDDGRFPGRLIVSLNEHRDHVDELSEVELTRFMCDIQTATRVLRADEDVVRVNIAILGNQESHVHAHVIPRRPEREPLPSNAPWQDLRPRAALAAGLRTEIAESLAAGFADR